MKSLKILSWGIVGLLVTFLIPGATYLFDLSVDVGEEIDLSGDDVYADVLMDLKARMAHFQSLNASMDPEQSGDEEVWRLAGGYVPYLNNYTHPPRREQSETRPAAVKDAPNIVFILADDLGINDVNFHGGSTWMHFATPQMDALASRGIVLSRHYVGWICAPTRGAFLTGRYPIRLGYSDIPIVAAGNLPKNESTLGDELQLLGYRTAIVGKWSLGFQDWDYYPTYRGFDTFYGYLHGAGLGYYSKNNSLGWLDLHDNEVLVTDAEDLELHLTTLLQLKVEGIIEKHATNFPGVPLFLYYAMQNVRFGGSEGYQAPQDYLDMCTFGRETIIAGSLSEEDATAYCALVIMLDEAVGDTVCALDNAGLGDNALVVVTSDNGAWKNIEGGNYPFRGAKGSVTDGGIHVPTFIYGSLIPDHARGSTYNGLVHITDWFITFLSLASGKEWVAPTNGADLDGVYILDAITENSTSPRSEIFHNYSPASGKGAMQTDTFKYVIGGTASITEPLYFMVQESSIPNMACNISYRNRSRISFNSDNSKVTTNLSSISTQPTTQPTTSASPRIDLTAKPFPTPTPVPTLLPEVPSSLLTPIPSVVSTISPALFNYAPSSAPTQLLVALPSLQMSPTPTQSSSPTLSTSPTPKPTQWPQALPSLSQSSTQSPTLSTVATITSLPTSSSTLLSNETLLPTPSSTLLPTMPTSTYSPTLSHTLLPAPSSTLWPTASSPTTHPAQMLTYPPVPTSPPTIVPKPISLPTLALSQTQSPTSSTLPVIAPTDAPTELTNRTDNTSSPRVASGDELLVSTNDNSSVSPASEVIIMWASASIGIIAVSLFVLWASQKWKLRAAAERLAWTQ